MYLCSLPGITRSRIVFTHLIVKDDEITKRNLPYLLNQLKQHHHHRLPEIYVDGAEEGVMMFKRLLPGFHVFSLKRHRPQEFQVDVYVDCTREATPLLKLRSKHIPCIVQDRQLGVGRFSAPPLVESGRECDNVFRAPDCSLAGLVPLMGRLSCCFNPATVHFIARKGGNKVGERVVSFSDSYAKWRIRDLCALIKRPIHLSYWYSEVVGPFYMAQVRGSLDYDAIIDTFGSLNNFEKDKFASLLHQSSVKITSADSTVDFVLPPEPVWIGDFAAQYPDKTRVCQPIVFFRRTFMRRGNELSFSFGFDANVVPVLANIAIIEYVTLLRRVY